MAWWSYLSFVPLSDIINYRGIVHIKHKDQMGALLNIFRFLAVQVIQIIEKGVNGGVSMSLSWSNVCPILTIPSNL